MKQTSVVGIVDLDSPTDEHGTPPDLLRCELSAVGYRPAGFRMLKGGVGYLTIFTPPARAPSPSAIVSVSRDKGDDLLSCLRIRDLKHQCEILKSSQSRVDAKTGKVN